MSLWSRVFLRCHKRDCDGRVASEAARALAKEGARQRREYTRRNIQARARQLREERGLPPHPALSG